MTPKRIFSTTSPVLRRLGKHQLTQDYALAGGGLGLARLASVATLILLTRALGTSAFAEYSLGWATWLLTSQMTSGLDLAYVNLQARGESNQSLLKSYWLLKFKTSISLVGVTILVVFLLWALAPWGITDAEAALIGGASGAATALYQTQLSSYQATQRFGLFALGSALLNLAILAGTLCFMALHVKSALPYVAIYGIVPMLLTASAYRHFGTAMVHDDELHSRSELIQHARWLLPSGAINSFNNRVDVLVASALLATHDFAIYAAAIRFFGLFQFALTSMGTVLLPRASKLGRETSLHTYLSGVLALTLLTGLVGLGCVAQAHNIAVLVLGHKYSAAASLIPALSIAAIFLAANVTLRFLLLTVGRPGAYALESTILLVAKVPAAFILIPVLGVTGAAWSIVASFAVGTAYLFAVLFANRDRLQGKDPATSPV